MPAAAVSDSAVGGSGGRPGARGARTRHGAQRVRPVAPRHCAARNITMPFEAIQPNGVRGGL